MMSTHMLSPPLLRPSITAVDEEDGVEFGREEGQELLGIAGAARVMVPRGGRREGRGEGGENHLAK